MRSFITYITEVHLTAETLALQKYVQSKLRQLSSRLQSKSIKNVIQFNRNHFFFLLNAGHLIQFHCTQSYQSFKRENSTEKERTSWREREVWLINVVIVIALTDLEGWQLFRDRFPTNSPCVCTVHTVSPALSSKCMTPNQTICNSETKTKERKNIHTNQLS